MDAPDEEQINEAVVEALNSTSYHDETPKPELTAQILQTQRLLSDLEAVDETMGELNQNLERYTWWSRLLTVVLIGLGSLSVLFQANVL